MEGSTGRTRVLDVVAALIVLAIAAWLVTPACGALFRCGCTVVGLGGHDACNCCSDVPHCPWCTYFSLELASFVFAGLAQIASFVLVRRRASRLAAAAAALAAFFPAILLAGALTWAATDYPHFLARDARGRLPSGPLSTRR